MGIPGPQHGQHVEGLELEPEDGLREVVSPRGPAVAALRLELANPRQPSIVDRLVNFGAELGLAVCCSLRLEGLLDDLAVASRGLRLAVLDGADLGVSSPAHHSFTAPSLLLLFSFWGLAQTLPRVCTNPLPGLVLTLPPGLHQPGLALTRVGT